MQTEYGVSCDSCFQDEILLHYSFLSCRQKITPDLWQRFLLCHIIISYYKLVSHKQRYPCLISLCVFNVIADVSLVQLKGADRSINQLPSRLSLSLSFTVSITNSLFKIVFCRGMNLVSLKNFLLSMPDKRKCPLLALWGWMKWITSGPCFLYLFFAMSITALPFLPIFESLFLYF